MTATEGDRAAAHERSEIVSDTERLETYARSLVESWPPLTHEQSETIAGLFRRGAA